MQEEAISSLRPGLHWYVTTDRVPVAPELTFKIRRDSVQLQCHSTLIDGFLKLGIFKGKSKRLIQQGAHIQDVSIVFPESDIINSEISSAFFPHGVGHSLGLDVHDVPSASKPETVTSTSSLLALGPNVTIPVESANHPSFYRYLRLRLQLAAGMVLVSQVAYHWANANRMFSLRPLSLVSISPPTYLRPCATRPS